MGKPTAKPAADRTVKTVDKRRVAAALNAARQLDDIIDVFFEGPPTSDRIAYSFGMRGRNLVRAIIFALSRDNVSLADIRQVVNGTAGDYGNVLERSRKVHAIYEARKVFATAKR